MSDFQKVYLFFAAIVVMLAAQHVWYRLNIKGRVISMVVFLLATIAGLLSGCQAMDAASCKKGDVQCLMATFSPEDMKSALKYVGPCYRMGRTFCNSAESCVGDIKRDECTDWWIENVCTVPSDPVLMDRCANSVELMKCDLWDKVDGTKWECAALYSAPLAGSSVLPDGF